MLLATALACSLAAADTLVDSNGQHFVEVGAKDVSKPKHSNVRKQWFGSDLSSPAGNPADIPLHKASKKHQHDGFNAAEMVHKRGHHAHSLEEQGQHHTVRADAGIPILQASKTKPDVRDTWSMDIEDAVEDDGMAPPRDVLNNPGDALLEVAEATGKKTSFMRREVQHSKTNSLDAQLQEEHQRESRELLLRTARASQCEQCMNCSGATPNMPNNSDHSDGSWCMCHTWDEWTAMTNVPGQYPGQSQACAKVTPGNFGCLENHDTATNGGVDCSTEALKNCSCDLNVFWVAEGAGTPAPSGLF